MIESNKFTPGPWIIDPDSLTDISPADDLRLGVASISHADEAGGRWIFGEQSRANASLISAAPDLLEALENLYRDSIASDFNEHWDSFKLAELAILKARGKS